MFGLHKLDLQNFRSHKKLSLDLNAPSIIITGINGSGKTNILEAISLFSVGKGIRGANIQQQLCFDSGNFWSVKADLNLMQGQCQIGTIYDSLNSSKRIIKIDDNILPRQAEILQYLTILWFLPAQAHLFQNSMSDKRKYFDRIVYSFDIGHAKRINAYEHYVRERNKLLKNNYYDNSWINAIEAKIASYAIEIVQIRLKITELLNQTSKSLNDIFPKSILNFEGEVENLIGNQESLNIVQNLLEQNRNLDARTGRCSIGAHKSQFNVLWQKNNMPAELCSTGEQKALLLSILISQITALQYQKTKNSPPIILLLDEMVAHLDEKRRIALFELMEKSAIQLVATGTDKSAFKNLKDAKYIDL